MTSKKRIQKGLTWSPALWALGSFFLSPAWAQSGRYNNGHMGQWMMGDWGMGWFGMLFMAIFWGLIIVGLVLFVKWLIQLTGRQGDASLSRTGSKAINILKERYARGEISRDQFESMKEDIRP